MTLYSSRFAKMAVMLRSPITPGGARLPISAPAGNGTASLR